jgi:anion-transporting  ArsA/GET3 family ATPase
VLVRLARLQPQSYTAIKSLEHQMASLMTVVQTNIAQNSISDAGDVPPDTAIKSLERQMSSLLNIVNNLVESNRPVDDDPSMYSTPRRRKKVKSSGKSSTQEELRNQAIVTHDQPTPNPQTEHAYDSTNEYSPPSNYIGIKTALESRYNKKPSPRRGRKK